MDACIRDAGAVAYLAEDWCAEEPVSTIPDLMRGRALGRERMTAASPCSRRVGRGGIV
jgi:hypothetical protein